MVDLRAPDQVMTLSRLGSMHQCRLSFMRQLTRRMAGEAWRFEQREFVINDRGVGHAVYCAHTPERTYSLVAFAHDLPDDQRSDRVIATAWDATFTLFDGLPEATDIDRLSRNVPRQEAGRVTQTELSVSRANRSVRLWSHIVEALAQGQQPEPNMLDNVGYLMRTTAVYGSGKLGAADREAIADRPELQAPYQVEMLSVYLTRWFARDLVEHMARSRGGAHAVPLHDTLATRLGIGNSTGLGMAPYLINHPVLFSNWIAARESAIATVRAQPNADMHEQNTFRSFLMKARTMVSEWQSAHPIQVAKLARLRSDLNTLTRHLDKFGLDHPAPWDRLVRWAEQTLGEDAQELLCSLILEPYGALVDDKGACMADFDADATLIEGAMPIGNLRALIKTNYAWALQIDWSARANSARAWYVSEEKLEPRLGERYEEDIEPYEQPLAPGRDAAGCYALLDSYTDTDTVAGFLAQNPQCRHIVRRIQITACAPYGEIHSNTIAADMLPIDMLRAKLAFFGVTGFDPRSDRWVRVCMYAGAPYPQDLRPENADFWVYPTRRT